MEREDRFGYRRLELIRVFGVDQFFSGSRKRHPLRESLPPIHFLSDRFLVSSMFRSPQKEQECQPRFGGLKWLSPCLEISRTKIDRSQNTVAVARPTGVAGIQRRPLLGRRLSAPKSPSSRRGRLQNGSFLRPKHIPNSHVQRGLIFGERNLQVVDMRYRRGFQSKPSYNQKQTPYTVLGSLDAKSNVAGPVFSYEQGKLFRGDSRSSGPNRFLGSSILTFGSWAPKSRLVEKQIERIPGMRLAGGLPGSCDWQLCRRQAGRQGVAFFWVGWGGKRRSLRQF